MSAFADSGKSPDWGSWFPPWFSMSSRMGAAVKASSVIPSFLALHRVFLAAQPQPHISSQRARVPLAVQKGRSTSLDFTLEIRIFKVPQDPRAADAEIQRNE